MTSRAERFRAGIGTSPLSQHSLNQKRIAFMMDGERRIFGSEKDDKATKARKRQQNFHNNFFLGQLRRSLTHIFNGGGTTEDIVYVVKQLGSFEKQLNPGENNTGNITITVLNLRQLN